MSDDQARLYMQEIIEKISQTLEKSTSEDDIYNKIVNAPFTDKLYATSLDLGIVVLLRVNEKDNMIDRVALSDTSLAVEAVRASAKPFKDIRIPLDTQENIIASTIRDNSSRATEDWRSLFAPALTSSEARRNQTSAGIECSIVYPLSTVPGGALIFSYYQPERNLSSVHKNFMVAFTGLVSKQLGRFSEQ